MLSHGSKKKNKILEEVRRLALVRETFCGTENNKMTAVRELFLALGLMAIIYIPSEIGKMKFGWAACHRHT
jgi:hypothetical protein